METVNLEFNQFKNIITRDSGRDIPELVIQLLWKRGFQSVDSIKQLLFPKLNEIKDPFVMEGMELAVRRLIQAFRTNEKVCIYADFDLDGTSGCALLYRGLGGLGFTNLMRYQPKRLAEGYGFHLSAVEELHRLGVSVIVTVDVGITAVKAVERARQLGVDVILTDHHLPVDGIIPDAYVVVNPNKGNCPSGLGYLCGAGVAFYLLRGLKRLFRDEADLPDNDFNLNEVLEYFTIATLTDMVPLIGDNRVLVKMGLRLFENTTKPGLRVLMDELGLSGRPLTSQDVAIRLAPKLNALSRMESEILPIDILLEKDWNLASEKVAFVMSNNSTRVQLQADAEKEAFEQLSNWSYEEFVFVASPRFHRGVIGLIATKLCQTLNKIAFVGSVSEDGLIVGSARLPEGQNLSLVEILSCGQEYLLRFGGHASAAGFEVSTLHLEQFKTDIIQFFKKQKLSSPMKKEIVFDLPLSLGSLNPTFMNWHDFLGPFGSGFPIPLFWFQSVFVLNFKELRGGHLKVLLKDRFGVGEIEGLLFSPTASQREILTNCDNPLDIFGEVQWNYFGGQKRIQILIRSLGQ